MERPHSGGLVISPMGIGEVLDAGFSLARRHYRLLVTVTAWGAIPSYALQALGGVLIGSVTGRLEDTLNLGASAIGIVIAMLGYGVGTSLSSAAVLLACRHLIAPVGDGDELTVGYLYGEVVGRILPLIGLGLLAGMASIPLVIVFPLGVYVWVRWSVAWVAVLFERAGPVEALRRSWMLTDGSWWHTVAVIFTSSLIVGVLSSLVGGLFGGAGAALQLATGDHVMGGVLNAAGQGLGFVLIEAFAVAILAVLYYELRARVEGFDLALRGLQIAQDP